MPYTTPRSLPSRNPSDNTRMAHSESSIDEHTKIDIRHNIEVGFVGYVRNASGDVTAVTIHRDSNRNDLIYKEEFKRDAAGDIQGIVSSWYYGGEVFKRVAYDYQLDASGNVITSNGFELK